MMGNVIRMMPECGEEGELPIPHRRKAADDAALPVESVAQDLCKARQRSGKSLTDVSQDLKIAPHHLIAIEAGRFEALPGRVYAIGFVRSYSAYLGLDSEAFATRLRTEIPPADLPMPLISPLSVTDPNDEEFAGSGDVHQRIVGMPHPSGSKIKNALFTSFLIGVLIYSGNYLVVSGHRMASPPVIQVPAQLAADAGLTREQTYAPPRSVKELALISPALALPIQVAPPQPVSIRSPATVEHVDVLAKPPQISHASLPLGQRYGRRNADSRIILRVHRRIRMAVLAKDNHIFLDRTLDPGDTYRVPNMAGLTLSASDAGAIELILDDSTVGFAGKDGVKERDLALDPASIVNRR